MIAPDPNVVAALVELVRLRHQHPSIPLRPVIEATAPAYEDLVEILHLAVGIVEHEISRVADVADYLSQLTIGAQFMQITEGVNLDPQEPPC